MVMYNADITVEYHRRRSKLSSASLDMKYGNIILEKSRTRCWDGGVCSQSLFSVAGIGRALEKDTCLQVCLDTCSKDLEGCILLIFALPAIFCLKESRY